MRLIPILLALSLLATPAHAQTGWWVQDNPHQGYTFAVPPGFDGAGDSGDLSRFFFNRAQLSAWSAAASRFETEAEAQLASDLADGWGIASRSTTATWASWSATKPGRVMHQHMIALCSGTGYAALRIEYAQVQRPEIDPLIAPLLASLQPMC